MSKEETESKDGTEGFHYIASHRVGAALCPDPGWLAKSERLPKLMYTFGSAVCVMPHAGFAYPASVTVHLLLLDTGPATD